MKFLSFAFLSLCNALSIGSVNKGFWPTFPINITGKILNAQLVLDSNWYWLHSQQDSSQNCYQGSWSPTLCPDPSTCWNNCAIEPVPEGQWLDPYGVSVSGNSIKLRYVTHGQYGDNFGSRNYLLNGTSYLSLNVMNREVSFEANMSQTGCGLNGAVYLVEMPTNGGPNLNSGNAASVGLGYADAQCTNVKFISGQATGIPGFYATGACAAEFDLWEANNAATQMAAHNCKSPGTVACNDDTTCGRGNNRYKGECDMDGAYFNPWQTGNHSLYGFGANFEIDTSKPFTVKTQFITSNNGDNGDLIEVKRLYVQAGKVVYGGSLTDDSITKSKILYNETNYHKQLGGLKAMGNSLRRGMVLVISLWDDSSPAKMLWLDGTYPEGTNSPGANRGPCSSTSGDPSTLRQQVPNSHVTYSNFQVSKILDFVPTPSPSVPTNPVTPSPSPVVPSPVVCSKLWEQCGGLLWNGPKCCVEGVCTVSNEYYSQCKPGTVVPAPSPSPSSSSYNCSRCICSACTAI